MRALITCVAAALLCASAFADPFISHRQVFSEPAPVSIGGNVVEPDEAYDAATGTNVFTGLPNTAEDVDALHLTSGGVLFSPVTAVFGFAGQAQIWGGDIALYDGTNASIFFSRNNFTSPNADVVNIDGFHLFESGPNQGKMLISTTQTATLGGLTISTGDIALWDPNTMTASLFFDDALITGAISQKNIDAIMIAPNGNLVISVSISNGFLGGLQLKDYDLVEWNGTTATIYLAGSALYTDPSGALVARDINAASLAATSGQIPEPGLLVLLCGSFAALARRRRLSARG